MAGVRLEQLRKVYDSGHVAVHGASFEVADGELVTVVGPSGCGKSTLLRMIAGLERISGGVLSIGGQPVNEVPARDRDIAMVFQSYALYPHMSVYDNLAFALRLRGRGAAEIDARVRAAAQTLQIDTLLQRRPGALSGGQRQRVALGRALVREPKVFLLDEPLSNLDARLRLGMRAELARLHRSLGATMIYVTHDQVEAMTLGQRLVVMNAGEVQQVGTPMALYQRPCNAFVAGFLGSPAMNFFQGRLDSGPEPALVGDGGRISLPAAAVSALAATLGERDCIVGLRPEHLCLGPPVGDLEASLQAHGLVESVEPVGNEAFLNLQLFGASAVSRVPPERLPQPGAQVTLHYAARHLHYFDSASGQRLPWAGAGGAADAPP